MDQERESDSRTQLEAAAWNQHEMQARAVVQDSSRRQCAIATAVPYKAAYERLEPGHKKA